MQVKRILANPETSYGQRAASLYALYAVYFKQPLIPKVRTCPF